MVGVLRSCVVPALKPSLVSVLSCYLYHYWSLYFADVLDHFFILFFFFFCSPVRLCMLHSRCSCLIKAFQAYSDFSWPLLSPSPLSVCVRVCLKLEGIVYLSFSPAWKQHAQRLCQDRHSVTYLALAYCLSNYLTCEKKKKSLLPSRLSQTHFASMCWPHCMIFFITVMFASSVHQLSP